MAGIGQELSENFWSGQLRLAQDSVSVVEEKAEEGRSMVAGQDINFDMIHALGKEKEEGQKEGKEVEERDEEPDQRPRSMSVGASRCF